MTFPTGLSSQQRVVGRGGVALDCAAVRLWHRKSNCNARLAIIVVLVVVVVDSWLIFNNLLQLLVFSTVCCCCVFRCVLSLCCFLCFCFFYGCCSNFFNKLPVVCLDGAAAHHLSLFRLLSLGSTVPTRLRDCSQSLLCVSLSLFKLIMKS